MFIRYMAEKAYDVAKSDSKKPRRIIAYSDLGKSEIELPGMESDLRYS